MGVSSAQMVVRNWMVDRKLSAFFILFTLLTVLACSSQPEASRGLLEYESGEKPQILQYLETGQLTLSRISVEAESPSSAVPFGEIALVALRNTTDQPIKFRIDCGTIFRAKNRIFTDLIVSRSLEGEAAPQSVWLGRAEVFSLQMKRDYPTKSTEYEMGTLAKGDLRQFSDCFCFFRPKPPALGEKYDLTPAQYAIWRITEGVTLSKVMEYAASKGKPTEEELKQARKQAEEHGAYTDSLLSECKLTVKFLD